jgi:hypothetical protein
MTFCGLYLHNLIGYYYQDFFTSEISLKSQIRNEKMAYDILGFSIINIWNYSDSLIFIFGSKKVAKKYA